MQTNEIQIILPVPPSVNAAYATNFKTKRRFKSKAYQEFINEADAALLASGKKWKITGDSWLEVVYVFYFPIYNKNGSKKKKDLSNFEKCISDYLSSRIEGFADEKIRVIRMEKIQSITEKVCITIKEIP